MSENVAEPPPGRFATVARWAHRVGLARKLAIALTVAAVASAFATYVAFTQPTAIGSRATSLVVGLLYLDLILLLALGALVARRMVQVWVERRRGAAGARLHIRLVVLFSLVALTPAVIVAVFSALVFNFGLQNWFSERVGTALTESQAVAESYLQEHRNNIRGDVLAMANDLNRQRTALAANNRAFSRLIEAHTRLRSLSEAIVFDGAGRVLGRSRLSFSLFFERAPDWALAQAREGKVVFLEAETDDRVRALVALERFVDAFLLVGRFVDAKVLDRIEKTKSAVSSYKSLEQISSDLQILFALIFVVVALLLLFAAVWTGLNFANQLARPISSLILAADRVRAGDLTARVDEEDTGDELGSLNRAFNRMTNQLESQRAELVDASTQIDARRRFIEAVLSGVSAGVIGLDPLGRINFPNQTASDLLSVDLENAVGRPIAELVPEMAEMVDQAGHNPRRVQDGEIEILRDGRPRTLLVRITAEGEAGDVRGFVVTFDDVTALISAQRKAAWSDVARRLAHEIKNPLTPIQLAAERLKRRYLAEIKSDPETFSTCIDTIIRQVDDIGSMIGEFSAFARMPAPELLPHDLETVVRHVVFLERGANPEIDYRVEMSGGPHTVVCDDRQVTQALTNLLQNAADSIAEAGPRDDGVGASVTVIVESSDGQVTVVVEDTGTGLPKDVGRDLTDPYVTTKVEGTGLGLAIVQKIMEDHGGALILEDRPEGGARVSLVFADSEGVKPIARRTAGASP
jgi:two-component system nitrogen regulation sensor histidine kinase NtrY